MNQDMLQRARILIVDDEEANVRLLEEILRRDGYCNVRSSTDPLLVMDIWEEFRPDLLLLDLHMPHIDGFTLLERLRAGSSPEDYVPVVVLTADIGFEAKRRALSVGAKDFLTKPYSGIEVLLRIRNLLEIRLLHQQVQQQNRILEQRVEERTRDLLDAREELLHRLGLAAEYRDDATYFHTERVGASAAVLARALGHDTTHVDLIRRAAPLHDVGKIGVSDAILLKPGPLTTEEFEAMKTHTEIGAKILSESRSPILRLAATIAQTHHERWDGSGYLGLRREAIPLESRIVCVVDVFDALVHQRPYKPAWPVNEAISEIYRQSGRDFDPQIVSAFRESQASLLEIQGVEPSTAANRSTAANEMRAAAPKRGAKRRSKAAITVTRPTSGALR